MKTNKKILAMLVAVGVMFGAVGCVDGEATTNDSEVSSTSQMDLSENSLGMEQRMTEKNQRHLDKVQPPVQIDWSLERDNLNKRIKRWNNPNKISYIYLLGDNGNIVSYFPIKGKVSSVNSKLSTNMQVVDDPEGSYDAGSLLMESPDFDGSYGTNGDAVFFYTTDDTYMEWNGKYFLSDNPIKLMQQPVMIYDKTAETNK